MIASLPWAILATALPTATVDAQVLRDWAEVERRAAGQTVYFNAWGGDAAINRYLDWAAGHLRRKHDIRLVHVKVNDIAETVSRLLAERAAGRSRDGSVDLMWINGENFVALKRAGLLWGPWAERLPNSRLIDWAGNSTTRTDGALATEGYELPWGTATLTFFYDAVRIERAPRDLRELSAWIESHPGRFTYPQPPAFLGSAFLKQLLLLLSDHRERFRQPVGADFDAVTAPLWSWLDRAHPHMWRSGRIFPRGGPAQRELLASGELDWMISFNPAEANRAIHEHELPPTIGAVQFAGGALANSHFLAIPINASSRDAALTVANFLISPQAQARKADERYWGDPSVLDIDRLEPGERAIFAALVHGTATPAVQETPLPEPHSSWTTQLEQAWIERYGH